jgi:hypothetical protein
MAISISVSAGSKRSHPTEQYGSINSQVSLSGEAGSLTDVAPVMRDLLAAAQAGCDEHLAEQIAVLTGGITQPHSARPAPQATLSQSPTTAASPAQRPAASQPYRSNGPQRRQANAPISAAQVRYLSQLGQRAPGALAEALAQHGVTTIDALAGRDASQIIDRLLQVVV